MKQLPNDVINKGYIETKPYKWEQVFFSPSIPFMGTENDFIKAGFGYEYIEIDKNRRLTVKEY